MVATSINSNIATLSGVYDELSVASDGCCTDNGRKYINFDKVKDIFCKRFGVGTLKSADMLLVNAALNKWIFVEFKDLTRVNDPQAWFNRKERQYGMFLKMADSVHLLSTFLKQFSLSYDTYHLGQQSFILVYKVKSSRDKIHQHISNNMQRYKFMFENILVLECGNFYGSKFL